MRDSELTTADTTIVSIFPKFSQIRIHSIGQKMNVRAIAKTRKNVMKAIIELETWKGKN